MKTFKDNPISISLARSNFWAFCVYYDEDFFRVKRRFLKEVAILFQEVIDNYKNGIAISVSVSMPPRAGKSYITSLFAAFWLAKFPELSVMRNSCTSTLYQKFSYDTRNIIKSIKFKEVFPEIKMQGDKQNLDGWNLETSKQVGYFGSGVGGTIIGFGANIAITDDLYKSMQDALSQTTNTSVKLWKESAHDSRKEKNCPEIFIGTRWVKDDIIGTEMDSGLLYKSIIIPALIDEHSFCEYVKSTDEYLKIRDKIAKFIWNSEYMQSPMAIEGLVYPNKFKTYSELPKELINENGKESIINQGWAAMFIDTADKGSDLFSAPIVQIVGINIYLLDVIFSPDQIIEQEEIVRLKCKEHNVKLIVIETNHVGNYFKNRLITLMPNMDVFGKWNSSNKMARINVYSGLVSKYLHVPEKPNKETLNFLDQCYRIVKIASKEDDAPDSITLGFEHLEKYYGLFNE